MKVILDTNTIISAFLWGNKPGKIIKACTLGACRCFACVAMFSELHKTLHKPKFIKQLRAIGKTPNEICMLYHELASIITPPALYAPECADPKDVMFLACALAAEADCLISGDKHLLSLKTFRRIPILPASDFCAKYL